MEEVLKREVEKEGYVDVAAISWKCLAASALSNEQTTQITSACYPISLTY
jgi:hypothetical protein